MSDAKEEPAEQKKRSNVDWSGIVTNAISTLVAAVFIGAAVIVWNAAIGQKQEIQNAVKEASDKLLHTDIQQEEAQKALTDEVGALRAAIESQRAEIAKLATLLTNRMDTSHLAGAVGVLNAAKPSWDEYVYRGRTNAKNLNEQIQQQVQQRWDPRQKK